MKILDKEEYRQLINKAGLVAKFYINQIDEIKYNPVFYEAFEKICMTKNIKIEDKDYPYSTTLRLIDRDNETICLIKKINSNEYEDRIVYYLNIGFNQRIKMYIDYNELIKNNNSISEINFEVLENYNRKDCGDIYGNGKTISSQECGFKGRIYQNCSNIVLEYSKYKLENITVQFYDEIYNYNNTESNELDKEIKTFKMTKGINNSSFLAYNEIHEKKIKPKQRVR